MDTTEEMMIKASNLNIKMIPGFLIESWDIILMIIKKDIIKLTETHFIVENYIPT